MRARHWTAALMFAAAMLGSGSDAGAVGAVPDEPELYSRVLSNGLTVLVRERPKTEVVALSAGIRGGSRDEEVATVGAAHFMEHMYFQGTPRRESSQEIDREISSHGGWLNAWTGWESINFQVVVPAD